MRSVNSIILALVMVPVLAGCWGSTEPPKAEAPVIVAAPAETEEARTQKRQQATETLLEQYRQRDIAVAKGAVADFYGRGGDLRDAVRRGVPNPFVRLCHMVEALLQVRSHVFNRLEAASEPISWAELGVERAEFWRDFVAESARAVHELLGLYRQPHAERDVRCGQGEGSWNFQNPGQVAYRLVWVTEAAKLSAPDGSTMRSALITDYRAYLAWHRGLIASGEASRLDGAGIILAAIRDAEQDWGIPRQQLRLTAEEKQLLAEQR